MKKILMTLIAGLFIGITSAQAAPFTFEEGIQASIEHRYFFDADVKQQVAKQINVSESYVNLKQEFKLGELPLEWTLGYTFIDLDHNITSISLPTRLEGYRLGLGTKFPVPFIDSDHQFIGVDVGFEMNTDDGDFEDSAARFPMYVYYIHRHSEKLIWIAGIGIRPDYDRDTIPLFGVIYKPNDRLTFNIASNNPNISYKINDKLTWMIEANYGAGEYEVDRGTEKNVVLKYDNYSAGVALKYNLSENVSTKFSLGSAFGRKLKYADDQGEAEIDDAIYLGAKLSAKF